MAETITFVPPGPGAWELEAGHHGRRPLTEFIAQTYIRGFEEGSRTLVARYGLPLERVRAALVEGCTYVRPVGVGEGDKPAPTPPVFVMKVLARLHPELRRRNRTAARARGKRSNGVAMSTSGSTSIVPRSSPPTSRSSRWPSARSTTSHSLGTSRKFSRTSRSRSAPTSPITAATFSRPATTSHCARWGISFGDAAALLQGSSPASTATAELLAPVAAALADAHSAPESVDAVRDLAPEARVAVDTWLDHHAWRVVTSDDLDRPTLAERPAAQLAALLAAAALDARPEPPDPANIRARVPHDQQALFDDLLVEARYGMRQRDDVVGTRWNWSAGLLRRALLEAGRRLADRSLLVKVEHGFELTPDELEGMLAAGTGPSATELAARAARRDEVQAAGAPSVLGDPEPPPPLHALPAPMARATAALMTSLEADTADPDRDALHGIGIGTAPYVGRARIANDVDDAIDRLEPGDVLIAPFTGPSFNSLLPMLGALVVEYGGAMCHAAIVAREFGLPAVIGASGATTEIADGALVEVDPVRGVVRILP